MKKIILALLLLTTAASASSPIIWTATCAFNLISNTCVPAQEGGSATWGNIIGDLANQGDLTSALAGKQEITGSTSADITDAVNRVLYSNSNTLAYFDQDGKLSWMPSWYVTSEFGIHMSDDIDVLNQNLNDWFTRIIPSAPSNNNRTVFNMATEIDPENSKNKIGDNTSGGVNMMNIYTAHNAEGQVGYLHILDGGSNFGGDTVTGGSLNQFSFVSHSEHIYPGYTVNNYQSFADYPNFDLGSTLGQFNALRLSPGFRGNANGIQMVSLTPFFGEDSVTNSFHSIENGGGADAGAVVTEYLGLNTYLNNVTSTDYTVYAGGPYNVNSQNITLLSLYGSSSVGQNVRGVAVDVSGISSPNQKQALSLNGGSFGVQSPLDTAELTLGGAFGNNFIGGQFHIAAGHPVSGVFGFGNNLGISIFGDDDMNDDGTGIGLGYSVNGFVNQLGVVSGKTIKDLNYMAAGGGVPPESTGGSITNLSLFRALGLLPSGGSLNVTNFYGFKVDSVFDAIGATNPWGVYVDASTADNFFKKSVTIGGSGQSAAGVGLELAGGKHLKSSQTSAPSALADSNAGAGASCSVSGATDMAGTISLTTGASAWSPGAQCAVTFGTAYGAAPKCQLTAANAAAAQLASGLYKSSTTTTLSVNFATADNAATAYQWDYSCVETN